jgi:hypothetical protein
VLRLQSIRVKGLLVASIAVSGCGYPGYALAMRQNFPGSVAVAVSCASYHQLSEREIASEIESMYAGGWRLALMSEYTSTMKAGHSIVICYERPKAAPADAPAPQ